LRWWRSALQAGRAFKIHCLLSSKLSAQFKKTAIYSDDAVLVNYPDQITQTGKTQMRARYKKRFANLNVRAEIIKRIVFSDFVVDHERVTAPPTTEVSEAIATYEVKNGKIVRVTFLTK
jgi:hypothetical protein